MTNETKSTDFIAALEQRLLNIEDILEDTRETLKEIDVSNLEKFMQEVEQRLEDFREFESNLDSIKWELEELERNTEFNFEAINEHYKYLEKKINFKSRLIVYLSIAVILLALSLYSFQ